MRFGSSNYRSSYFSTFRSQILISYSAVVSNEISVRVILVISTISIISGLLLPALPWAMSAVPSLLFTGRRPPL